MKLKILAIVALGVVGIGAAFVALGGLPASASSTTQYLTGTATTGDVTNDVAATGTIATTASYGLSFGVPAHLAAGTATAGTTTWTVKDVNVAVGDAVKTGQVLATADASDLNRQLSDATASLGSAKIQLANADDALAAATTTAATRQAQMNVYNAQTQVSNARKTRLDLLRQISLATLRSPIDGIVTTVAITKGLDAPSGDAIVIDSNALQVTADVAETDVASMSVGQVATVTVSAVSAELTGQVAAIAPTASTSSTNGSVVSYPVTISLTGAPKTVRPGMTASITITIDSVTNVLTVPSAALRGTAGNYSVLIMNATGEPTAQAVEVGLVTNATAEIKGGLAEGQRVVTGVNTAQTGTPTTGNGFGGGFGGALPGGGGTRRGGGN